MNKVTDNNQSSESLWQDKSRIDHYFSDFLTFEQTFVMWFLYVSPFWGFDPKYLETPVRRLSSLLNDICSVIESISKDINFYLDQQFNPEFYINKNQYTSDTNILRVRDFYSLIHNYLGHPNRNIPAPSNFNTGNRTPLINNIGVSTPVSDNNQLTQKQVKETRMHYDFDYLAHIDFRLGTSSKKVQIRTDVIPINLDDYSWIQYPLKNAHLSDNNLPKGEKRPEWCKVYQGTKHALADNFQECKGSVILQALGALYILCIFAKYLPETKIPDYPEAPEIGSYPLEDFSNGSLLFKPTITRTTFSDLSTKIDNHKIFEYKKLSENMFIIKDSEIYFDIMLDNGLSDNQQLADQLKKQHIIIDLLRNLPLPELESKLQQKVVLNTYCHYKITNIQRQRNNKQRVTDNIYDYRKLNKKQREKQTPKMKKGYDLNSQEILS